MAGRIQPEHPLPAGLDRYCDAALSAGPIFGQYRIIDKRVFGDSWFRFRNRYAELGAVPGRKAPRGAKRVVGFKNQEAFRTKFRQLAYEIRLRDVLKDLPQVSDVTLRVRMSPKAMEAYGELARKFKLTLESGELLTVQNALVHLLRLQQVTSGFLVSPETGIHPIDTAKADALAEFLDGIPIGEPVVVFARFVRDLETIVRVAKDAGRLGWQYSGSVKQLEEWWAQGGVIAMQIQTGGVGISLTAARYCVYYSVGLSLGDYLQSRARLERPGQKREAQYTHLIAAGTVDERIMQLLSDKQDVIREILQSENLDVQEKMLRLKDGPAEGIYTVKRAPLLLRATVDSNGKGDVLDQLEDTPAAGETVSVYRRVGEPNWVHINAKKVKGFYAAAEYVHLPDADGEALRDNDTWRTWANANAPQYLPRLAEANKE